MLDASKHSHNLSLFPAVFGPTKWYAKAARVLNLHEQSIFKLARGQHPLSRRHLVTIENYLKNRRGAYSTEIKASIARVQKAGKLTQDGFARADLAIRALKAEMTRHGL